MKQETNRPISLEDLLRLKRTERPNPEFWTEFDRQLRAKQLAALVARRPWWHDLSRAFARLGRYRIPIGAAAVLTLSFVSLREYRSNVTGPESSDTRVVSASPPVAQPANRSSVPVVVSEAAPETPAPAVVDAAPAGTNASPSTLVVSVQTNDTPMITPLLGAPKMEDSELSPSARHISANLAAVQADPVVSRHLLVAAARFEPRTNASRLTVEPLQQITPPSERRRSHLLTAMVSMASLDTSADTAQRVASRIAEDRLYDREHRLGGRGDRLSWKF